MDMRNLPARRSPPLWSIGLSTAPVAAGFRRRETSAPRPHDVRDGRTEADAPERGWIDVLRRVYERFSEDRVMSIAGGVTFFVLLAIFPAIAALVSIYGLFADPASLNGELDQLSGVLPSGAIDIVGDQMRRVASQGGRALGITFLISLAVSLWSANSGMKAMFDALNIVYDEKEKRGFFRLNAMSLVFTFLGIAFVLLALAAVVVLPIVVSYLGLQSALDLALRYGRWPILFVAIALGLAAIYRFGPSRQHAKWRWITWGSAAAALLWLAASALFSWYAASFGNFDKTYGTLGAAIGFMMWIWISAMVVLAGAELDAELERQDPSMRARPTGGLGREA